MLKYNKLSAASLSACCDGKIYVQWICLYD